MEASQWHAGCVCAKLEYLLCVLSAIICTVEERTLGDGPPSDYAGHLYSYRESMSKVILRTLVFSNPVMQGISVGFQDILIDDQPHEYECVASNYGVTNTSSVIITPIGNLQHPLTMCRCCCT